MFSGDQPVLVCPVSIHFVKPFRKITAHYASKITFSTDIPVHWPIPSAPLSIKMDIV